MRYRKMPKNGDGLSILRLEMPDFLSDVVQETADADPDKRVAVAEQIFKLEAK